jgi:ribosome-binding protein aMBF1 (putative translation factor)
MNAPDILENIEARLNRLEALHPPKRPKPKQEPKRLHIDPKAVRASMAANGWNQSDLARQMGVGKYLISVWLSGKNCPSSEHWALLAQFVDVV